MFGQPHDNDIRSAQRTEKDEKKELKWLIIEWNETKHILEDVKAGKFDDALKELKRDEKDQARVDRFFKRIVRDVLAAKPQLEHRLPEHEKILEKLINDAQMVEKELHEFNAKKGRLEQHLANHASQEQINEIVAMLEKDLQEMKIFEKLLESLIAGEKHVQEDLKSTPEAAKSGAMDIKITKFECDSHGDVETEYHMNIRIEGTINGEPFSIGRGDEDLYCTGARTYSDKEDLLEHMCEMTNVDGFLKQYEDDDDKLEELLEAIYSVPELEKKLEELRLDCNKTAEEMNQSWHSQNDY